MKKKYFIYAILPIMAVAVLGAVYAAADTEGYNNPMSDLVSAVAQKFNLNVSDVQAVFNEHRDKMEAEKRTRNAEMEAKGLLGIESRINQAVADGKLTQEQADKILAKKSEFKTWQENMENMTQEERQAAMKEHIDSLKQWAADNGIPEEYLMFAGFGWGRGGRGGPDGFKKPGFGGFQEGSQTSN